MLVPPCFFHPLFLTSLRPSCSSLPLRAEQGGWQLTRPIYDYSASHPAAEVLSWEKPRVVLFRSFMSPEEVQYLIAISAAKMERSQVLTVAGQDGTQTVDNSRTSFGAWPPQDDEVVSAGVGGVGLGVLSLSL